MNRMTILIASFAILTLIAAATVQADGLCDYTDLSGALLPISESGTTVGATDDHRPFDSDSERPDCWQGQFYFPSGIGHGPEVSFKWTVPNTGYYAISLARSDFDADLFLYDLTCPEEPAFPDDFICGSNRSLLDRGHLSDLPLHAGQEILIVVDGFYDDSGEFVLDIIDTGRNFDEYLQWAMDAYHIPGMGVGLVNDDGLWNAVYGLANIDENRPVTDSTNFIVWSTSKAVTAAAIMTCWEDGLFELDEDVNEYLQYSSDPDEFEVNHPHHPEVPITMRQSLCHVASIRDTWTTLYELVPVYEIDSPISIGQFSYDYLNPAGVYYDEATNFGDWAPGMAWEYAQPDVTLAAYVTECVSESSTFLERCQERIFDPLGMERSTFLLEHINPDELAMEYAWNGNNHTPYPAAHAPWYPAAFLRTNAIEMTRFLAAIMNGGQLDGQQILQPATIDSMLTVQYPDIESGPPGQGLLWRWEEIGGRELWGHNGGGFLGRTGFMFSPTENIGAVVMTNCGAGGWDGLQFIVDALLDHARRTLVAVPEEGARPPAVARLEPCYPNPFNPLTNISFALPRAAWAEVGVYDLAGRRMAVLASREFTAGGHLLNWNGRDASGRDLPSGTYLVRLKTADAVETSKAVLVR